MIRVTALSSRIEANEQINLLQFQMIIMMIIFKTIAEGYVLYKSLFIINKNIL